jgi:hypothetical protein
LRKTDQKRSDIGDEYLLREPKQPFGIFEMPISPPIMSTGSRQPEKRPQPIPRKLRDAISLMVYGRPDDQDCAPLTFIEAAKGAGIAPDVMRKYLDRPNVRALLRSERRAFREAICAGNEGALKRVRDTSQNGMCTVAAVRALEALDGEDAVRSPDAPRPGVQITIVHRTTEPSVPARMIDITPKSPS